MRYLNEFISFCCRQKFKESTAEDCYLGMIRKRKQRKKGPLNNQQLYALKLLCQWRDSTARNLDESVGYVIGPNSIFQLYSKDDHGRYREDYAFGLLLSFPPPRQLDPYSTLDRI